MDGDRPIPRRGRGEDTRGRLLDAARSAFRGVDWPRARVEDVCRAAGIGHGTFYSYYANRAAVVEALVHRHASELFALALAPWASGDLGTEVRRIVAGYLAAVTRDADVREIWHGAARTEPRLAELVPEVRHGLVERLRDTLDVARRGGLARADADVVVAASALVAGLEHAGEEVRRLAPGADPARLGEGLADLWTRALQP